MNRRFREPAPVVPAHVDVIEVARSAREAERAAKAERARAMDWIVDLLLERAELRRLLTEAVPYLWATPARPAALADQAMLPKAIARRAEAVLGLP